MKDTSTKQHVQQIARKLDRQYQDLPLPEKIFELIEHYAGIQRANATNGTYRVPDGTGHTISLKTANAPYLIAIPFLLERIEQQLDIPATIRELLASTEEQDVLATLERVEQLVDTAQNIIEEEAVSDFRHTQEGFGERLQRFLDMLANELQGRLTGSEASFTIERELPRIVTDLSTDPKFDAIREFLTSLETHNGKLVWPNDPVPHTKPKPQRIRKYELSLLIHHLVLTEGLPKDYSSHAYYSNFFCWSNFSSVTRRDLGKKLDQENRRIEGLKPGILTPLIQNLYSS